MANMLTWSARAAEREVTAVNSVRGKIGPTMKTSATRWLPREREEGAGEEEGAKRGQLRTDIQEDHLRDQEAAHLEALGMCVCAGEMQSMSVLAVRSKATAPQSVSWKTGGTTSISVITDQAAIIGSPRLCPASCKGEP